MPGGVVRRSGKTPVGEALTPIRLAFELGAVTGGAMLRIDDHPARRQSRAFRIGLVRIATRDHRPNREQTGDGGPNQPSCHRRSRHSFMKMLDWPSALIA